MLEQVKTDIVLNSKRTNKLHLMNESITYEVSINFSKKIVGLDEILKNILHGMGYSSEQIVEVDRTTQTYLSIFISDRKQAHSLKRKLYSLKLSKIKIFITRLLKKDWQTKWKTEFKPFQITDHFQIVPRWMKKEHQITKNLQPIYIDTSFAFGTGMHATTRFVAQFLDRCSSNIDSIFDIGTGTGILTIIALKSGIEDAIAIDICPDSIGRAKENIQDNGLAIPILKNIDFQKFRGKRQYDFVAANLNTFDLIHMGEKIVSYVNSKKYLAISGISLKNYTVFRENFRRYPLRCLKIEKAEGWVGLLYKKQV